LVKNHPATLACSRRWMMLFSFSLTLCSYFFKRGCPGWGANPGPLDIIYFLIFHHFTAEPQRLTLVIEPTELPSNIFICICKALWKSISRATPKPLVNFFWSFKIDPLIKYIWEIFVRISLECSFLPPPWWPDSANFCRLGHCSLF
jgi:hypothetical protein